MIDEKQLWEEYDAWFFGKGVSDYGTKMFGFMAAKWALSEAARTGFFGLLTRAQIFEALKVRDASIADETHVASAPAGVKEASWDEVAEFKNFHRLLCERFGYAHDKIDWKRDQLSLIEHIAALIATTAVEKEASDELASMTRMFNDAVRDFAAITEALNIDPDESGGADPILEAIEALKSPTSSMRAALQVCLNELETLNKGIGWRDGEWHAVTVAKAALASLTVGDSAGEPDAWLHILSKPGTRTTWASIDEDDMPNELRSWLEEPGFKRIDVPLFARTLLEHSK